MSFSPRIVQWALDRTRFGLGDRILEIGAGTGQLTGELLSAGANVTALEPSEALANLLSIAYTDSVPEKLVVVRDTFEDFESQGEFDVVAAANSFHWLDPAISYKKTAQILQPDGRVCLFWYFPILADTDLQIRVNSIVREFGIEDLVREPDGYGESLLRGLADGRAELEATGHLKSLDWVLMPHRIEYSATRYCDLLQTYASLNDLTGLRNTLQSTILNGVTNVELTVYEYACVAAHR